MLFWQKAVWVLKLSWTCVLRKQSQVWGKSHKIQEAKQENVMPMPQCGWLQCDEVQTSSSSKRAAVLFTSTDFRTWHKYQMAEYVHYKWNDGIGHISMWSFYPSSDHTPDTFLSKDSWVMMAGAAPHTGYHECCMTPESPLDLNKHRNLSTEFSNFQSLLQKTFPRTTLMVKIQHAQITRQSTHRQQSWAVLANNWFCMTKRYPTLFYPYEPKTVDQTKEADRKEATQMSLIIQEHRKKFHMIYFNPWISMQTLKTQKMANSQAQFLYTYS